MIAPHILAISAFLCLAFGWHLLDTAHDWRACRAKGTRAEKISAFEDLVAASCLMSFAASYLFRTALVLLGLAEDVVGVVLFFTLLGVNIPGAAFIILSRRFD